MNRTIALALATTLSLSSSIAAGPAFAEDIYIDPGQDVSGGLDQSGSPVLRHRHQRQELDQSGDVSNDNQIVDQPWRRHRQDQSFADDTGGFNGGVDPNYEPRHMRRHHNADSYDGNQYSNNDGRAYWNGHQGYRTWHRGYRRHGDFWFPAEAFIAGALITGAITNTNRVYHVDRGSAHVQWCYDHYRSYRAYDNTYKSSYGARKQCRGSY